MSVWKTYLSGHELPKARGEREGGNKQSDQSWIQEASMNREEGKKRKFGNENRGRKYIIIFILYIFLCDFFVGLTMF